MLLEIMLIGVIIALILFIVYDRRTTKEVKAHKDTIESQHALIEVLGERLKEKDITKGKFD
ncbi:hypothetical protein ACFSTA_03075 [Ornithinibacillus salinisoli]|uniref:Uncharacterized protein n=1 Tax=Ornithinibacillus salinisoli TaxID=1848459 RepID=A0ABW4VXE4_9BACI